MGSDGILDHLEMTCNVLGEKDDKDKAEHGDETSLDDLSVPVFLLEPRSGKDRQDGSDTGDLTETRLPSRGKLVADFFVDIFSVFLSESR